MENHCPLGLCGPWSQSLSLLMTIWLKDCTGATVPLKHLLVGNDNSRCCHLEKHLAGLAFGPMVSMTRLEWSLLGPSSGQTIIKVNFQIESTLNYSWINGSICTPSYSSSLFLFPPYASCLLALLINTPTRAGIGRGLAISQC